MPTLVCQACGRVAYSTAPLGNLFPEERRCPRCGAYLDMDRREGNRRREGRRQNSHADPGPPGGVERRVGERRAAGRRKGDHGPYSA